MFLENNQENKFELDEENIDNIMQKENSQIKALKYKNIGIPWSNRKNTTSLSNLEAMLETERIENDSENWSKLSKTIKIKKLLIYSEKYKNENNLSDDDYEKLIIFFKDCLDKKKLQRVKDVDYNRETGEIINISALIHNKTSNHFTLKNINKKDLTHKCLQKKKNVEQCTLKIENNEI